MPTVLRLILLPHDAAVLRTAAAPAHGWFLNLIRLVQQRFGPDGRLPAGGDLHSEQTRGSNRQPRPYSLSPFFSPHRLRLLEDDALPLAGRIADGARFEVRPGEPLALRVAFLDDHYAARLIPYLWEANAVLYPMSLPRLGHDPRFQTEQEGSVGGAEPGAPCTLLTLPAFDGHPDRHHLPWDELLSAPPVPRLTLAWETLAAFHREGADLVRAEPHLLLADWQEKWSDLAARHGGDAAGIVEAPVVRSPERLAWADRSLIPGEVTIKRGTHPGYRGGAILEWRAGATDADRAAAHALARFATLAGTGAKTALGLGQTRLRGAE